MKGMFPAALVAAVSVIASAPPASAVSLSLGFKAEARVTAGLDAETRALIERMPKEVKEQTLDLLQKALPLIDTSVDAYLRRANEIIGSQIVHAGCAIQGTAQGTTGIFKASLPFQGAPAPVTKLSEDWEALKTKFKRATPPSTYISSYADFLVNTAVTTCQVEASEEAIRTIEPYQADTRARWLAWRRVGLDCKTAEACAEVAFKEVSQFVSASDERDRKSLQAEEALARYAKPQAETGWFVAFRQEPFENSIISVYRIQDSVSAARLKREWNAIDKLAEVDAQYQKINAALGTAWGKLRQTGNQFTSRQFRPGNTAAKDASGKGIEDLSAMLLDIDSAVAISDVISDPAEDLKKKCMALADSAKKLNGIADAELRKRDFPISLFHLRY